MYILMLAHYIILKGVENLKGTTAIYFLIVKPCVEINSN